MLDLGLPFKIYNYRYSTERVEQRDVYSQFEEASCNI